MTDTAKPAPAPLSAGARRRRKSCPNIFKAYKHVWVFIEQERGQVHPVSWELLGAGRKLADKLGVELAAVVLGAPRRGDAGGVPRKRFAMAPTSPISSQTTCLADYRNEPYTKALTDLVNAYKPEILLLGATTLGRDLAGSVATTLLTGLTADCTELDVDADGSLAATRPTFGGSLLCTIYTLNYRPQMATVRPRVMPMPERVERRDGRIIEHPLGLVEDDIVTKVLQFIPDRESTKSNLAFADVVVAGGLGLGSPENFQLVRQLAAALGAEFGCSRPLVQKGWIGADRQIGQTGKTHPAQALHRRGHLRRDPASRRRRGRRHDRRDQHRQERADLRFRACRDRHRRGTPFARADGSVPPAPVAAFARPARELRGRLR